MVHTLVSGSQIIANVQDSFNIDSADWIGRAPNWITRALEDLGFRSELKVLSETIQASEYRVALPCSIDSIEAVEIDEQRVYTARQIKHSTPVEQMSAIPDVSYIAQGDSYIMIETQDPYFADVDVTIHYKSAPVEYDEHLSTLVPLVPQNPTVHTAIELYLFIKLLGRGYKHNVFSLDSSNPATNPYIQYHGLGMIQGARKKARIDIKTMSKDQREIASGVNTSFIKPDRYATKNFNGSI